MNLTAIDRSVLERLRELEARSQQPGFVAELCRQFAIDAAVQAVALCEGAEAGSRDQVARAAHKLRSLAAMLGALELAARCGELDSATRACSVDEARAVQVAIGTVSETLLLETR